MAKKFNFSRLLFRNSKKSSNAANDQTKSAHSTSKKGPTSTNKSSNNKKEQTVDSILKVSKQKQQHLLSLLKYSNDDDDDITDDILILNDIPPEEQSLQLLRLYLATVQKLKRYQPNSMEKQKAVYGLLSCLVIQQELDRFDPEFEPVGRKPRKTRYISTLLDTPVESIIPHHHPVLEAKKRKPFVKTFHVIIPSDSSAFSSSTVSLVSTSSSSTLTSSVASTSSYISSPPTFFYSSSSFPPHKRSRIGWLFSHNNSNDNNNKINNKNSHHCHLDSLSPPPILPRASSFTTPQPHLVDVNAKNLVSHLWTSRSDPHLHASFGNHRRHQTDLQQHLTYIDTTTTTANTDAHTPAEDEDDVPLAVLRTRNVDRSLESDSVHICY